MLRYPTKTMALLVELLLLVTIFMILPNIAKATPCKSFDEYLALGSSVTSIRCVTGPRSIPAEISSLTNLRELQLVNSGVTGPIPASFSQLTKLTVLDLRTNLITAFPDLSAMSNLVALDLRVNRNFAPGPIPNIFLNMKGLKYLDLTETKRTNTIPTSMELLSNLENFDISKNQISGTISKTIVQFPSLKLFSVYSNLFTGVLPTTLARPTLDYIRVNHNRFSGPLQNFPFPNVVYRELGLSATRFHGNMPKYQIYDNAYWDVYPGNTVGPYIANGVSCNDNSQCSSGECSTGNRVCCAAFYTAPNQRGTCVSGTCTADTGECTGAGVGTNVPTTAIPTNAPNTEPTWNPSMAPTRKPTKVSTFPPALVSPLDPGQGWGGGDGGGGGGGVDQYFAKQLPDESVVQTFLVLGIVGGLLLLFGTIWWRKRQNDELFRHHQELERKLFIGMESSGSINKGELNNNTRDISKFRFPGQGAVSNQWAKMYIKTNNNNNTNNTTNNNNNNSNKLNTQQYFGERKKSPGSIRHPAAPKRIRKYLGANQLSSPFTGSKNETKAGLDQFSYFGESQQSAMSIHHPGGAQRVRNGPLPSFGDEIEL